MQVRRTDPTSTEHVLTVTGDIGVAQVAELQAGLLRLASQGDADVLLDARGVTSFSDSAMAALTAGRSRAKFHHRRLVVLDDDGGAITASLRRTGRQFRYPVFPDQAAAHDTLVADRAALARSADIGPQERSGRNAEVRAPAR